MKKWLNDLIVQLLLTVLFLAVFFPGCLMDIVVGDVISPSSMTEPATKDDFEIMLVVYASMIAVTAGCGIWGKNLVANILAGTYGLLFSWQPLDSWITYRPLSDSWASRLEILFNTAHLLMFILAFIGLVLSVRKFIEAVKE